MGRELHLSRTSKLDARFALHVSPVTATTTTASVNVNLIQRCLASIHAASTRTIHTPRRHPLRRCLDVCSWLIVLLLALCVYQFRRGSQTTPPRDFIHHRHRRRAPEPERGVPVRRGAGGGSLGGAARHPESLRAGAWPLRAPPPPPSLQNILQPSCSDLAEWRMPAAVAASCCSHHEPAPWPRAS